MQRSFECKVDEVCKHERSEASVAAMDEVPKREGDKVPQVFASRAYVEQATEAPPQLSTTPEHDSVQGIQQRTVKLVFDVPDEAA